MSNESGKLSLNLNGGISSGLTDVRVGDSGHGGLGKNYVVTGRSNLGATEVNWPISGAEAKDTAWMAGYW